ncbi:MAG: amidase [Alphaproteobacteria bacterium]|nr:amidase [Alphaproteobacteria bacterium]
MTTLPNDPFADGGISTFAKKFKSGEVTSLEVTEAFLARIEQLDNQIGSFQFVDADRARKVAQSMDQLRDAGVYLGPLMGVPVGVKDIFAVEGMPTTNGSKIDSADATGQEGPFIKKLKAAGAVILGKTKTVEYAFGATGVNSVRGTPRNPHDLNVFRVPGGSSSGSAAATAAGLVGFAIGSDTGGSVRIPAAFCGLFGHKTTVGMWPTSGVFPLSPTLDTIGPLCRNAADAALVFEVLEGYSIPQAPKLSGLKFGLPTSTFFENIEPDVQASYDKALDLLTQAGVEFVEMQAPELSERAKLFREIVAPEFITGLGRSRFVENQSVMDPVSASRAAFGLDVDAVTHAESLQRHRELKRLAFERFVGIDAWISPTCVCLPMPIEEVNQASQLQRALIPSQNTQPANIYGICAVTTPIQHLVNANLPVGLQIMCPAGEDARLLSIGGAVANYLGEPALPLMHASAS